MTTSDRIEKLQNRALHAEAELERRDRMIAWLCGTLARTQGRAVRDDGELVCSDMPPEECSDNCAECWAVAAEVAVTPIEYYLKPEYQGRVLIEESAEDFLKRKRGESGAVRSRARVIQFRGGEAKPSPACKEEGPDGD